MQRPQNSDAAASRLPFGEPGEWPLGSSDFREPDMMWLRGRCQPLKLSEYTKAVIILGFSFAMPVLLFPTVVVLLVGFLDRMGLTVLGKLLVLVVLTAIVRSSLMGWSWLNI
jgi:hypothetical protein